LVRGLGFVGSLRYFSFAMVILCVDQSSVSDSIHHHKQDTSPLSSSSSLSSHRPSAVTTTTQETSRQQQQQHQQHHQRGSHGGGVLLERSCKDLHRQTVSLERLRVMLGDNVDRAFKRVNEVFKELHFQSVSFVTCGRPTYDQHLSRSSVCVGF